MLNEIEWREFNFIDIFNICEGFYNKRPLSDYNGDIPFIGATESNNGVTQFCNIDIIKTSSKTGSGKNAPLSKKIFDGNCICVTNNGSVGYAYYQFYPFTCTHDVNPLYLKNYKLNKHLALFLITAIEKQRVCFKYSRKWRPSRMKKSKLLLPVDKNGNPNYRFMEEYAEKMFYNANYKIKQYLYNKMKIIGDISTELEPLSKKDQRPFKIIDLFESKRGNQNNMESLKKGNLPLISAKNINNGLKDFCEPNSKPIFNGNCLTINNDGDGGVGLSFYHPYDFMLDSHVTALIPKFNSNVYILLFISNAIKKQRILFSHGRSISNSRLQELQAVLPIDKNGNIDFKYMEEYVKKMISYKYKKILDYLNNNS